MPTATYSFRHQWHLAAPQARVHEVLVDVERYVEWWPQVVAVGRLGEGRGLVLCRSTLPYTLELVITEQRNEPGSLEVAVGGHLAGTVAFDLEPDGGGTRVSFRQDVVVRGRLALASPVARPLLVWNHRRMMRGWHEGLSRRVA